MYKDTPMLLEKDGRASFRTAAAGHARQRHDHPHAHGGKATPPFQPRTVLVTAVSESAGGIGAACAALLAESGHRVVTIMDDECTFHAFAGADAAGRVVKLPGSLMEMADIQSAIKALAAPFRSVDAVVDIIHLPARRKRLLAVDALSAEPNPAVSAGCLLNATRAALPGLLASERGHVIAVTVGSRHHDSMADEAHAGTPCSALRAELDNVGVRFTRIAVGPMQRRRSGEAPSGNRPQASDGQRGVLAPSDVAQAIAWTLARPDHVAVRDMALGAAPQGQPALSPREREVLEWTACGKTAEEISCILTLSVSAVNFHVRNLLFKLQCCNKTAAVARAALLGMLV